MESGGSQAFSRWQTAALVAALLALLGGGAWFYRDQERAMEQKVAGDLTAIARLKADQIVAWRQDQLEDAFSMQDYPNLSARAARLLTEPTDEDRRDLLASFQSLATQHDYGDILLVDVEGRVLLELAESGSMPADFGHALTAALRDRRTVLTDLQ